MEQRGVCLGPFRLLLPVLALLLTAQAAWAKPNNFYSTAGLDIGQAPGTLLRYAPMRLPPFYRAKAWRILYVTRDYANRPVASSGVVLLSTYAPEPQARRIVAWAHPTTGIARKCAPSLRKSPTESIEAVNELITYGFITVATDYPGLGTAGPTGYLVGKGQGQAVLDSVRAAKQIPGIGGGNRFAIWGYSQGGHAALFAAQLARSYAPELNLVGVAAAAPPTQLAALFRADIGSLEGRVLSALTLASWSRKYGIPLVPLVDPAVARSVEKVASDCVDDLGSKLEVLTDQGPLEKRFFNYDPTMRQPWSDIFAQNSISRVAPGLPVHLVQGSADTLVRPKTTWQFASSLCRSGTPVTYTALKRVSHGNTAKLGGPKAIAWIADRFAGKPPPNACR